MSSSEDVVLVVEDDPDDRALIARAFKKAGVAATLHFAHDGEEAVSYFADPASPQPVVVLLDLKLPRRSGFEVLAFLKGDVTLKPIPVVILTSSRESRDLRQAYALGANSYLVKPTRTDALLGLIATVDAYWLGLNQAVHTHERGR
jgi:two-component system response regulator